jgi:glycosyltransferase involved in cell wall biosynthesis
MTDRIAVFIPCYNCERQIARVLRQFRAVPKGTFQEIVVIDNRSQDRTASEAVAALSSVGSTPARVVQNLANYGLGGSHKAMFDYAARQGHTHVAVLHGDDQGAIGDLIPIISAGDHRGADACLGARFMRGSRLIGYSKLRTFGNHAFNAMFSIAVGQRVFDLGSGLNIFGSAVFEGNYYHRYPDDLRFNVHLLLGIYDRGLRLSYFPISWREDDQLSNVRMISQALRTAAAARDYIFRRQKWRIGEHRTVQRDAYTFEVMAEHRG